MMGKLRVIQVPLALLAKVLGNRFPAASVSASCNAFIPKHIGPNEPNCSNKSVSPYFIKSFCRHAKYINYPILEYDNYQHITMQKIPACFDSKI